MKKVSTAVIVLLFTISGISVAQDTLAFRSATGILDLSEKAKAIEKFVTDFPSSKLKARAYDTLFDIYLEQRNESAAKQAAHNSLQSVPPEARMGQYNRFSYALAINSLGLDSALVYVDRAIAMAGKSRSLSGFQDTKAYVLYQQKKYKDAEDLQRVAIVGHESDPEFLTHLALYEKENGKLRDALKTMSKSLYFGADEASKKSFLSWIDQAETDQVKRNALKKSIVLETVQSQTDTMKGAELTSARSNAAIFMADLGVEIPTAKKWAAAAVKSLDKKSSIDQVVRFKLGHALVLSAEKDYKEAVDLLESIRDLVDPYETKYWIALASNYGSVGDRRKAVEAYMEALVPRNDKSLRTSLEGIYREEFGTIDGIDTKLDSMRNASAEFHPGEYGKKTTPHGKVVLAELFTGAECGPCVSADMAFDALSEYYPRTAVAILEYHVHIPGPDPLTTDGSWDKYLWNEGQGTPTVIIDGRESIIGGGPRTVARNRFGVYRYAIRKFESEQPRVDLAVKASAEADSVGIVVELKRAKATGKTSKPSLMIALVEKSVDYTGANGISKHAFVVRTLVGGSQGTTVGAKQNQTITKKVSISDLESQIKSFLDDPTTRPSWSNRRPFAGWRSRPEKINRSNLAVVAWVQDLDSKEVLQAAYTDVTAQIGMK